MLNSHKWLICIHLFVSALFLLWPTIHFKFLRNFIGSCECYKFFWQPLTLKHGLKVNESTLHHASRNVSWSNSLWHHTVTDSLTLSWNKHFLCVCIEESPALTVLYLLDPAACPLVVVNNCWKTTERASGCRGASGGFTLLITVLSIDNCPVSTNLASVSLVRQGGCYFADWPLTCLSVPLVFMVGLGFRGPTWAGTGVLCQVCCRKKDDRVTGRWMDGAKKKKRLCEKTPPVVKLEWTQS